MVQLDRVVATLIASIVVLMGFTVQNRAKKTSVESTLLYMAKTQTLQLGEMLEDDLAGIGYGTLPTQDAITHYDTNGERLDSMVFRGIYRDSLKAGAEAALISYKVAEVDTALIQDEVVPLYELRRWVNTGSGWRRVGGSMPTLTDFTLTLLNENNTTASPETAQRVRVQVANGVMPRLTTNISERMDTEYLRGYRRLHWTITLSPSNIRGYQGG